MWQFFVRNKQKIGKSKRKIKKFQLANKSKVSIFKNKFLCYWFVSFSDFSIPYDSCVFITKKNKHVLKKKRDFPHFLLSYNHYPKKAFYRYSDSCVHSDGRNCKISPFKFYITHKMADNINLYYFIQQHLLERVLNKKVNWKTLTRDQFTHCKTFSKFAFNGHQKSVHFLVRHFFRSKPKRTEKLFFCG